MKTDNMHDPSRDIQSQEKAMMNQTQEPPDHGRHQANKDKTVEAEEAHGEAVILTDHGTRQDGPKDGKRP